MASPRSRKPAAASTDTPVSSGPAVTLAAVIAATKAGGFEYTPAAFHTELIASGDVEINPEMTNEAGMIATRATAKHLTEGNEMTQTAPAVNGAEKPKFEIESGVELPQRTRNAAGLRAGRTPVYPFEQLEIGQSFFVPNASADKPAAKAMASTVAGANARYTEKLEGQSRTNRKGKVVDATKQLRKFKIFDTERTMQDGSVQKGARIFRVELDAAA